jgi:hypothetical protein
MTTVTQEQTSRWLLSPVQAAAVRDSMRGLPGPLQMPLTLFTGKPFTGQRRIGLRPTTHLVTATLSVGGGLAVSAVGWTLGAWWLLLLLLGWAMALHGARNLRMMMYHQAAHRNMWNVKRADRVLGRIIAGLLIVQDFDRYAEEHVIDHHAIHHMTVRDPTVQAFIIGLRMTPGMTREQMWRRLYGKILSPAFHARFFWGRVRSYTHPATRRVLIGTVACYAVGLTVAGLLGWLPFLLVAWFLPLTLFFQVSNVLRLCVKHTFPPTSMVDRRGRAYFAGLTNAIFIGEAAPGARVTGFRRWIAWLRWTARMLLVHVPSRYLVLTGDTVVHDFHHRFPMSRDWANYIFAREENMAAGHPGWPVYQQVWGLRSGIDVVFASLAAADPDEYSVERIGEVSDRELFTAFDD